MQIIYLISAQVLANPSSMRPKFVIAVPADVLAPSGARPSSGTVMIEKFIHIVFTDSGAINKSNYQLITPAPYMVLTLFATRFADYAGGIRVSFI